MLKPNTMIPAEKRAVLLLASAQALFQTVSVTVMTASGVVGLQLAADKNLATLPIAAMMIGTAAMMIPAALLMQRFGRKLGFVLGTLLGVAAGLLSAAGIYQRDFWLFTFASTLAGAYAGFTQYYRFAAADIASPEYRSRAISWVIAGGVVAAVVGPNLVRFTQHWGPQPFIATYLALTVLSLGALLVVSQLSLPALKVDHSEGAARPLWAIVRQPIFLTAVTGSTIGFAVMSMVMTATPIAMLMNSHTMGDSATVIQWHVLGMYLPSFFTGSLIRRLGVLGVMAAGIALLLGHVAIALSGIAMLHFLSGLILLGVGWNFLFVGGTTLLTEAYRPAERAKAQATHDFIMFGVVSLASLSAGGVLNRGGWQSVNTTVLPALALAAFAVAALALKRRAT